MILAAVLTGAPRPIGVKSGQTGFFKQPLAEGAMASARGLAGDHILDTANHGGPDQALYLMGSGDYAHWRAALGLRLGPGAFGENLVIEGWTSAGAAIGDRLRIKDCLVELTAPRVPCVTLAAVMGDRRFPKRFFEEAHPGAYARVLKPGLIRPGMTVDETRFRGPRITMAACLSATADGFRDEALVRRLAKIPAHHELVAMAQKRARTNGA